MVGEPLGTPMAHQKAAGGRPPTSAARGAVLIAGAQGEIGTELALQLAGSGFDVILAGRRVRQLEALLDRIEVAGGRGAIYPIDFAGASIEDYAELAQAIESQMPRLQGFVWCVADFEGLSSMATTAPEPLLRSIHVNLSVPLLLARALVPQLERSRPSTIVLPLAEECAVSGAFWGGWSIAQAGLRRAAGMLGAELEHRGITVQTVDLPLVQGRLRARAFPAMPAPAALYPAAAARRLAAILTHDGGAG